MRGARRAPVRPTRTRRGGPVLGILLALAVGAGVAVWLILAAFPVGARADAVGPAPAGPGPVEVVGPATVVASSSCVGEDPRDTVAVDGPAGRRLVPLDGCGSPMGARMTVRVAFVGGEPADAPARVLGTGSSAALVDEDDAGASPLTGRLAILLTGVAALGMAGLLVAVVHDRRRRTATPRTSPPARRRPVTTTASRPAAPARRRETERTTEPAPAAERTHRPASRPARAPRAGRPAGLDAGRRLPAQRAGTSRSARGSGTGTRRPAAGPHRG
ncbi:hypothetical protein ACQPX6_23865 [Actinomycetospora sp. CA-101289]|uniref:hypothetical protein n=1 Tax=Actinomycetospora sp. CA-101289 TaxID=3239893 RepID=UPI003D980B47